PPFAVEGPGALTGDLRQRGLPRQAPAAHRLPVVRSVRPARRPPAGRRDLLSTAMMPGHLSETLTELGITLSDEELALAFVHRSYAYENGGLATNERLEFLGDAVLGVVMTEYLYRRHPDLSEGQLARLRAAVVNSRALAVVARELGLGSLVKLGKGEEATGGRDKNSILADTTEALIGAIHIGAGLDAAARFIHR